MSLRLAVVTDIHHGRVSLTKRGPAALPLLRDVVATVDAGGYDLLVDLGGFHLVMWQMDVRVDRRTGFAASDDDLAWLAADLAATTAPAVVFSHLPLDGASLRGNYWFENNERFAGPANVDEIQAVLRESATAVLCVAGHVHRNQLSTIDGVHHLTVQSLTDSYHSGGEACGAWATLELEPDSVTCTVHGLQPMALTLPLKAPGTHWEPSLPPFERLRRSDRAAAD